MDWYLDAGDVDRVRELRHEFAAYLAAQRGRRTIRPRCGRDRVRGARRERSQACDRSCPRAPRLGDEAALLTVSDLGPGFTPEIKLPDPLSESGRGLYIVAQLMGEVTVRRGRDCGAEVSVRLPVQRRKPPSAVDEQALQRAEQAP